jgi:hypothetical protein
MVARGVTARAIAAFEAPPGRLSAFLLALLPGLIFSVGAVGWFGTGIPSERIIAWPSGQDMQVYLSALDHMATSPWSDGLLRAGTIERGTHIIAFDAWPLPALVARLLGIDGEGMLRILAVVTPMAVSVAGGAIVWTIGGRHRLQVLLGAVFALVSAPFLTRFDPHLHVAQFWTLIGALIIAVRVPNTTRPLIMITGGALIAAIGALFSAYLGAVSLMVLVGGLIDRARHRARSGGRYLIRGALVVAGIQLFVFGALGFLSSGVDSNAGGFGTQSMNLLSPFYPIGCYSCSPFPSIGAPPLAQDFVSSLFLGLGVIVGLIVAGGRLRRPRGGFRGARHTGLALALIAGLLYAIGPTGALGPIVLWQVEIPTWMPVSDLFGTFRASASFAWPTLFVASALAAVAIGAPRAGRLRIPLVARIVGASCALLLQLYSFAPALDAAGWQITYAAPRRDEFAFIDRVIEGSRGVLFIPRDDCSPVRNARRQVVFQEISSYLSRGMAEKRGEAIGLRTLRPFRGPWWCYQIDGDEAAAMVKSGWTIIYPYPTLLEAGEPMPVDLPRGVTCRALPGYVACLSPRVRLTGDRWSNVSGLPIDPTTRFPLLPSGGLDGDDPRLSAATVLSLGGWERLPEIDLRALGPDVELGTFVWGVAEDARDIREIEAAHPLSVLSGAVLRLTWPAESGDRLRLEYTPSQRERTPVKFSAVDGVIGGDGWIEVTGTCEQDTCTYDGPIGLQAGWIEVRAIRPVR